MRYPNNWLRSMDVGSPARLRADADVAAGATDFGCLGLDSYTIQMEARAAIRVSSIMRRSHRRPRRRSMRHAAPASPRGMIAD